MAVLTVEPADVLHGDLGVAPHRGHDGVERLAAQAARRHAEVAAVRAEGERALVHVEHHEQPVGHQELLVRPQQRRVRAAAARALRVVVHLTMDTVIISKRFKTSLTASNLSSYLIKLSQIISQIGSSEFALHTWLSSFLI